MRSRLLDGIANVSHGFDGPNDAEHPALIRCRQVHGDTIVTVADSNAPADTYRAVQADGLISRAAHTLGVQTADCLPVLLAARDGRAVAAVHAGWRGLEKGILLRAVENFSRLGVAPSDLVVAIGPAIGACCFEVSRDIVDTFERAWGGLWTSSGIKPWSTRRPASAQDARGQATPRGDDLWLDLERIARLQLLSTGVKDAGIEDVGHCTYCGPGALASYRRGTHLGTGAGRQWSWISRC